MNLENTTDSIINSKNVGQRNLDHIDTTISLLSGDDLIETLTIIEAGKNFIINN